MKRSERTCAIMQILTDNPNKDFSMGSFAAMFGCAKSSISEDIKLVRDAMDEVGLGYVETTSGSKGGVRFVPYLSDERVAAIMERVKTMFEEPDRMLGSGFLYILDEELYFTTGSKGSKVSGISDEVQNLSGYRDYALIQVEDVVYFTKDGKKVTKLIEHK